MKRIAPALALAVLSLAASQGFAADAVVVPAPSDQGGVVIKKSTEVTTPSAEATASSAKHAAHKTTAAAHHASDKVKHDVQKATQTTTTTETTKTTVDPGNGTGPVVVKKEKTTTSR